MRVLSLIRANIRSMGKVVLLHAGVDRVWTKGKVVLGEFRTSVLRRPRENLRRTGHVAGIA